MNQVTDLVQRGVAALNQNNPIEARLAFEHAAAHDKDCLDAYWGLALLRFPGESYYGLLARLHHALRPRSYVEIGVESGTSMALALPQTACIGIDPAPAISVSFVTPLKIFTMTSGDFFARHDLSAELGNKPVDLAFIDGLHVFENVLEDFINIERFAARRCRRIRNMSLLYATSCAAGPIRRAHAQSAFSSRATALPRGWSSTPRNFRRCSTTTGL